LIIQNVNNIVEVEVHILSTIPGTRVEVNKIKAYRLKKHILASTFGKEEVLAESR